MVKILPVKAVIYFKQPYRFRIKSKYIAILPKKGFSNLSGIIRDSTAYTAVYTGKEDFGKSTAQIISLIPASDSGDLILAKFWIDLTTNLVLKSQLTTNSAGTMIIDYFYLTQKAIVLPDKMIFTIDVKKFKIPKPIPTDLQNPGKAEKGNARVSKGDVILISLKNYKINEGLSESIIK